MNTPFVKFDDVTDPKLSGPPVWYIIHSTAFASRDRESTERFICTMKNICNNFPCKHCKGHCQDYINKHPIEKEPESSYDGKKTTMFMWSWKFHNAVNQRLNKPIINFETAYKLYDTSNPDNAICSKNCEEAGGVSLVSNVEEQPKSVLTKGYIASNSPKTPSNTIYQNSKKLTLIKKNNKK